MFKNKCQQENSDLLHAHLSALNRCISFFKISLWGVIRRGKVTQTMYIHVSKCKNDKIKINK
jgi:hypothetical protein